MKDTIEWRKEETPYLKEILACNEWESHPNHSFFIYRITEGRKTRIVARCTQCDEEYTIKEET